MSAEFEKFTVSVVQRSDYSEWVRFINEQGEDLLASGPLSEQSLVMQDRLFDPRWTITLAIHDVTGATRELVATASIHARYTLRRGIGTVEYVLVHPHRRREGIGRLLMIYLINAGREEFAPSLGRLQLVSEPHRTGARALYESSGFVLEEGSDRHYTLTL